MRSFDDYLQESLEDNEFAEIYADAKAEIELSVALTKRREALKLTQQQLAEMTGIKQPMLARIEKGQIPKPVTLQKIAKALQIGIVFTGEDVKVIKAEYVGLGDFLEELVGLLVNQETKIPLNNVVSIEDFRNKRKPKPLTVKNVEMERYENVKLAVG